ncbi:DUF4150 domain-containing protein [Mesorhizobium helmanticense]|uniref:DUF4150 domain-containing protein n=1 Tax=Mesorhizobium helmanticense TaxID=1776423 RepID=UPI001FE16731|nr:DUF4150 domain-containing protein [Mesorhizobium helmanticense]
MPTHITVNGLGLTHKSSTGFSKATIPDVCKTPTPGGPVPMPYPNFAMSSTLGDGTTTVFAKGGAMIANKGSQYKMSIGDEPGTVGGVKSNTFKQATDWITYSFDVKMDGKNACRDTDKKFHNNKNTVDLMGNANPAPGTNSTFDALKKMVCECDVDEKTISDVPKSPKSTYCRRLGDAKHDCVDKKIVDHNGQGKEPVIGAESGWKKDDPFSENPATDMVGFSRKGSRQWQRSGSGWPDAVGMDENGDPQQCFDFKFKCKGTKKKGAKPTPWGKGQRRKQERITREFGSDPDKYPPIKICNIECYQ